MEPLPKLSWFPLYVKDILSSYSWQQMKDYQRGWYIQLLLRSADSERPGYLPLDGSLWRLAGARAERYFEQESAAVMACFKRRQMDGREWIYNERLLKVLEEQAAKQEVFLKRSRKKSGKEEEQKQGLLFSSATTSISREEIQKAVEELFEHYCNVFTPDPRYKLTAARRAACADRLIECLGDSGKELSSAKKAAMQAIGNLSRSEFHIAHGHCDWLDHLFGSREIFEKRLNMKNAKPALQPGTRAGVFADPEFGRNEELDQWLSSVASERKRLLKEVESERDGAMPCQPVKRPRKQILDRNEYRIS